MIPQEAINPINLSLLSTCGFVPRLHAASNAQCAFGRHVPFLASSNYVCLVFSFKFVFGSIGFACDEGNSNVTVTFQEQFFSLLTVLMPSWPRMFSPATNANCLHRPKFHSCYILRKIVNIFKRNNKKKNQSVGHDVEDLEESQRT